MMFDWLRKFFTLAGAGGLLYLLAIYAVSDVNSKGVLADEVTPVIKPVVASPSLLLSADALVHQSIQQASESFEASEKLAIDALVRNPSSGRAVSQLLELYEKQGDEAKADQVAALAGKLWPAHTFTRSRLADYWGRRNQIDKAVDEWNILLTRSASYRSILFPRLLNLINDPQADAIMAPFVVSPPRWWDSFFAYLSRELPLERLREVYQARVLLSEEVTVNERRYYVARLIKERQWTEAHDEWFVGLKPHQARYSGHVFDGGFESSVYNQGFGWHVSRSKNPKIKPDISYGIKGRKALQVTLRKNDPINFRHVSQRLLLEPGAYELSFRYRTDTLTTTKGLNWRVRCIEGGDAVIAESEPLLGSNPWTASSVNFEVPAGCGVQLLRLEAVSRFRHEQYFSGTLWLDNVMIRENKAEE